MFGPGFDSLQLHNVWNKLRKSGQDRKFIFKPLNKTQQLNKMLN